MQKFDFPVFLKFSGPPYWKTEKFGNVDTKKFSFKIHFSRPKNPILMKEIDFQVYMKFSGPPYWKTEKFGKVDI